MVAQRHLEAQKVALAVVAHPLWEQVELGLAHQNLVVLVERVLQAL
jgi:hypothetical protein